MLTQLLLNLDSHLAEPFSTFLENNNKELIVNDIIFYDSHKIVYMARLRKEDFIDDMEKILHQKDYLKAKYGIEYFEIVNTDRIVKTYSIIILQNLPKIAVDIFTEFKGSVFIISPMILNKDGLKVNVLAFSEILDNLKMFLDKRDVVYQILKIGGMNTGKESILDRERMILYHAFMRGYFEQPKKNNMQTISKELGITKYTFMRILRKAEKKVIGNYLNENGFLK